nr:reverse transcriptase domain-containing protein [Tanacetum cinerariifolium]
MGVIDKMKRKGFNWDYLKPPKMSAASCAGSYGKPKGCLAYKKEAINNNSGFQASSLDPTPRITLKRMSAMANTTLIVTTVTKPTTNPRDADATPRVNIQDFCKEYYEDILPIIMDKGRSRPRRLDTSNENCPEDRERFRGIGESYDDSYSHSYHDRNRSRHMKRRMDNESPLSSVSKSNSNDERTRMPNNVKTYYGTGDLEDHVKIFQAAAQVEQWAMPTWWHMFNSTLIGAARKYVKDPVEIHYIEQKDGETIEDFIKRFKVKTRRMKGAPECMRISRFMHGVNNLELTKRLNEHVPKTMEEMMITTTAFIRGEVAADSKKKGKEGGLVGSPPTRTPKEILAAEAGKFQPLPPMVTPVEKRSSNKFCDFHNDNGHSTDESSSGVEGPLVIEAEMGGHMIHRMYEDGGSSMKILYEHCFNRLRREIKNQMVPTTTSLTGFSGETIWPLGQLRLLVTIRDADHSTRVWMNFMIVRSLSPYNGIIERPEIREIQAVPSTAHGMLKVPVKGGIVTIRSTILIPAECTSVITSSAEVVIGGTLSAKGRTELCAILKKNLDIFAWQPSDMTGVSRSVAEHRLNIREGYLPVRQKKIGQAPERAKAIQAEVQKLVEAGIIKEVYYHDWLSNPVMVKKHDGSWWMCVDFTDLNKARPQDCYPLPEINWKVESLCGYPFKCFLDAYKGYHQIHQETSEVFTSASYRGHYRSTHQANNVSSRCGRTTTKIERHARRTQYHVPAKDVSEKTDPGGFSYRNAGRKSASRASGRNLTGAVDTLHGWIFAASNNEAEYEALIAGLRIAAQMGVKNVHAEYVIREIHCSMHAGPRLVVAKAIRIGYYWPTMHRDARDMIRTCNDCQIHRPVIRNPQQPLTSITAPWPFYKWRIDIAGPFPEGPCKVKFLIVATDYFTKWIEAKAVATITGSQVKKFVWDNIVCRFGLPGEIISDNGKQFSDNPFKDWCDKLNITQRFTSVKNPQSNGLVERENQSSDEGIKARLAVIPIEIRMPTYRTAAVDVVYNDEELLLNLDLLEERRERVAIREAKAKLKITKYYNARVRGVTFRPGDFVYRSNDASHAVE